METQTISQTIAVLGFSLLFAIPAYVCAGEAERDRRAKVALEEWRSDWEGTPRLEDVRRLQENYGLVPLPSAAWDRSELVALRRGAASLPAEFFDRISTPLFLERRERSCHFGQGRYTERCPTFDTRRHTFFIYDVEPLASRVAQRTMPGLDRSERRRLQYRRAAVHLVVSQYDRRVEWSSDRTWREINGWREGEPLNSDWRGFNRPLGRRSAHLDFVTFAEAYFARPSDVVRDVAGDRAGRRIGEMNPDDQVVCRMMTRSRFLERRLRASVDSWEPPRRVNEDALEEGWNRAGTGCPAFEQWADVQHLEGLELIFASATSDQPESLYGHLMLRVEFGPEAALFRRGFEPVYQFRAVTGRAGPFSYIAEGVFGGFDSVLTFQTLRGAEKSYLRYQERNLRRYRLNLTRSERLRVMQRIWESQRHFQYPYRFFRHNCASFVVELLRPAIDRRLPELPDWIVMPTDVLDALAATGTGEGEPLLETRYLEVLSNRNRARRAVRKRRELKEQLAEELARLDERAPSFAQLHAALESPETERRRAAYRRIADEFPFQSVGSSARQNWITYLYHSVAVERYFLERARFDRLERQTAQRGDPRMSRTERLEWRRRIYEIDDLEKRLKVWNRRVQEQISRVAAAETSAELSSSERRLRQTYLEAIEALSRAIEAGDTEWNGAEYVSRRRRKRRLRWMTAQRLAVGPSGARRATYGAYVGAREAEGGAPEKPGRFGGAAISAALMRDELGEVRLRGFRPTIESRALDVELEVPAVPEWHRRLRTEATLYRYYDMKPERGPLRDGILQGLGWGMDLGVEHDGVRELAWSGRFSAGALAPLVLSEPGAEFLALGAFGTARGDAARRGSGAGMLGVRLFVRGQLHLYGPWANTARVRLGTHQYAAVPGPTWEREVDAELTTRHAFGDLYARPLWVVPYLEGMYTTIDYTAPEARSLEYRAGARLEFSF